MIHDIVLSWPLDRQQLEKIDALYDVMGDAIVFNFSIDGLDVTNAAIRGEVYDLNTSNRLANELGGAESAPEITVSDTGATSGVAQFTAVCATGLTATMQQYSQVEFAIWLQNGQKFTIYQQAIHFTFERVIWQNESQGVYEDTGEDPLF